MSILSRLQVRYMLPAMCVYKQERIYYLFIYLFDFLFERYSLFFTLF
jgi:hypothetical protein